MVNTGSRSSTQRITGFLNVEGACANAPCERSLVTLVAVSRCGQTVSLVKFIGRNWLGSLAQVHGERDPRCRTAIRGKGRNSRPSRRADRSACCQAECSPDACRCRSGPATGDFWTRSDVDHVAATGPCRSDSLTFSASSIFPGPCGGARRSACPATSRRSPCLRLDRRRDSRRSSRAPAYPPAGFMLSIEGPADAHRPHRTDARQPPVNRKSRRV